MSEGKGILPRRVLRCARTAERWPSGREYCATGASKGELFSQAAVGTDLASGRCERLHEANFIDGANSAQPEAPGADLLGL